MMFIIYSIVFILGTIIGSFINVLVVRMHQGVSLGGRSQCVHCHKQIPLQYLVPVFGYLLSGQRCFSCKKIISVRYLLGEVSLGLLYMVSFFYIQKTFFIYNSLSVGIIVLYFIFVTLLFFISYYDILYQEIPTGSLVIVLIVFTGILFLQNMLLGGTYSTGYILSNSLRGLFAAVPFLCIWLISRGRLIGFGDILIMGLMGLHLGLWQGAAAIIISFWTASIVGIFWAMYYIYVQKKQYSQIRQTPLAFGPFLCIGWLVTLFFGSYFMTIFIPGL